MSDIDQDDHDDHPRPSKRSRSSLFLADSDDDEQGDDNHATSRVQDVPPQQALQPDINAIFADAENDETLTYVPLAPPLDLDALRREADARHARNIQPIVLTPHQIMPSSSPPRDTQADTNAGTRRGRAAEDDTDKPAKGGKERRKIARLDEGSLLGPNGFPLLVKQTKNFQPKGKGHEVRLSLAFCYLNVPYPGSLTRQQTSADCFKSTSSGLTSFTPKHRSGIPSSVWRNSAIQSGCMYVPQSVSSTILQPLTETQVALSVWRDEARGIVNGRTLDLSSDDEDHEDPKSADESRQTQDDTSKSQSAGNTPSDSLPSSRAPSLITSSPSPSRTPSSASDHIPPDDDFDIDDFLREEGVRAASGSGAKPKHTYAKPRDEPPGFTDLDEAMWNELMTVDGPRLTNPVLPPVVPMKPAGVVPAERLFDEDEDMWDAVRELENRPPPPTSGMEQVVAPSNDDDDWDDMYL
jgi:replication fork protection complex subunit Csm3/Swi3